MKSIPVLVTLLFFCSCESTLKMDYAYSIESSIAESNSPLQDGRFKFNFVALPSGVLFTIQNLSEEPAYIVWDDCYFVEPSGNTFNALNTDLVDESDSTAVQAMKSNYKTQVPAGTSVTRFTTATTNTQTVTRVNSTQISLDLTSINYTYDGGSWYWSDPLVSSTTRNFAMGLQQSTANNEWTASRYYPGSIKTASTSGKDRRLNAKLDKLRAKIEQDQPMSLGLRMDCGGETFNYRFDFQVEVVFASRKATIRQPNGQRVRTYVELGSSRRTDGWDWVFVERSDSGTATTVSSD
jgi:hypothetical protein